MKEVNPHTSRVFLDETLRVHQPSVREVVLLLSNLKDYYPSAQLKDDNSVE